MKEQSKTKQTLIQKKTSLDDALEYAESIFNTVREPLIVLDQDLRVVTASRSFYDFFKVKPKETEGQLIYDLGNKQWDIPKLRELLETILPQKTTFDDYEVKHDFTTIGKRTMLLNARQIQRVLGKERIILLSIEDITKSKQDESARVTSLKALLESQERYKALFERSLNLIYVMDFDGQFIDANKAVLNLFGYKRKEISSVNVASLVDEDQLPLVLDSMQEIKETGLLQDLREIRLRHKDGREIYLEIQGSIVMSKGKPVAIQMVAHDITERKRAKDALLWTNALLNSIVENIPNMIFLKDTVKLQFVRLNRAGEDLLGFSRDELIGKSDYDLFPKEQADFFTQNDRNVLHRKDLVDIAEESVQTRNNGERILHTKKVPILNENGEPQYLLGISEDITERKNEQEAFLASREQLRSLANRLQMAREEERTRIARKIHDDIGGLLTGLKIDLSLLLRTSLEIENKTIKKSLLDGIEGMIKSIDVSVPDIRRIAMELRPGVLDDLGLVSAMEWHLNDFQKRTGIHCKLISSVECINMDIDFSTALFRIFQEVLTNVVRHSKATEVRAYMREDEESFLLEVEDNGKGFEKENLLSSESLGFLGMKERAQIFGGSVTMTGKPGMGTKVTVNIPQKRKLDQ